MRTWRDEHGVVHIVDEFDTGYIDPVYDWVPLCGAATWVPQKDIAEEKPTCLRCVNVK